VNQESDIVILGGGLTGLAAASSLGDRAVLLEKKDRPGGLVRTRCFDGYWFDLVLHLLYFDGSTMEKKIREILGDILVPIAPEAWVETAQGTTRFPFQLHSGGLKQRATIRCLAGLAEAVYSRNERPPANFEEVLLQGFGKPMCEVFMLPYNRKMWKRPLCELAASGFQWNIAQPAFEDALASALAPEKKCLAYNSNGWYPRPPPGAETRGMEVLSNALASRVSKLRLNHTVESIDLQQRTITVRHDAGSYCLRFTDGCLSTIPLPKLLSMCHAVPDRILTACQTLKHNRVVMAAFSIKGPRPTARGHWRYYADESLIFNRLIYMHEFDPLSAPHDGWGLMAEITERAEDPLPDRNALLSRVWDDIVRAGEPGKSCEKTGEHMWVVDPAYVVNTPSNDEVVEQACAFLEEHGITPLGRYGHWGYSSMAQVLESGFDWGMRMATRSKDPLQPQLSSPML